MSIANQKPLFENFFDLLNRLAETHHRVWNFIYARLTEVRESRTRSRRCKSVPAQAGNPQHTQATGGNTGKAAAGADEPEDESGIISMFLRG